MSGTTFGRGGIVDVDPQSVREAAGLVREAVGEVDTAVRELRTAADAAADSFLSAQVCATVTLVASRTAEASVRVGELVRALHATADAYEYAEFLARAEMANATPEERRRLLSAAARISARNPDAATRWEEFATSGPVAGLAATAHAIMTFARQTRLSRQSAAPVARATREVIVEPARRASARPAASTAEMLARVPHAPGSAVRIRIDRYAWRERPTQFHVYIAGTKDFGFSKTEAFDMTSNLAAYANANSESKVAVEKAMRLAGITSDTPVHLVGHSQGGMIANQLAMGDWNVLSLTAAGSPVESRVPPSVMAINIRHDNDVVALLQGGGSDTGVGSSSSFVATRTVPGEGGAGIGAHALTEYIATAKDIDSPRNPWRDDVRALIDTFAEAEVSSTEFTVRQTEKWEGG